METLENIVWSASSDCEWVNISPNHGTGNTSIEISSKNDAEWYENDECVITFRDVNNQEFSAQTCFKRIRKEFSCNNIYTDGGSEYIVFPYSASGETLLFTINKPYLNNSYSGYIEGEWINNLTFTEIENDIIEVKATLSQNSTENEREASIVITVSGLNETYACTRIISQSAQGCDCTKLTITESDTGNCDCSSVTFADCTIETCECHYSLTNLNDITLEYTGGTVTFNPILVKENCLNEEEIVLTTFNGGCSSSIENIAITTTPASAITINNAYVDGNNIKATVTSDSIYETIDAIIKFDMGVSFNNERKVTCYGNFKINTRPK